MCTRSLYSFKQSIVKFTIINYKSLTYIIYYFLLKSDGIKERMSNNNHDNEKHPIFNYKANEVINMIESI